MRAQATLILAPHIGQVLTQELASRLVAQFPSAGAPIDVEAIAPEECGSLTFRAERLLDIISEIHPLHEAHWQETEAHRHGLPLDLNYGEMVAEEQAGTMVQFTARCAGVLVGNFRLYLRRSRHTGTMMAKEDTLYLAPEHRHGRNSLKFLDYPKKSLRSLGVREFRADVKTGAPAAARMLVYRGFKPVGTEYVLIEE